MKKIIALSSVIALCSSIYAEELTILSCGIGTPGLEEPQLMGLGLSPNGKYICGPIESAAGIFVADRETGKVNWKISGEDGGELRNVDNEGVATGYVDDFAVLFPFDKEVEYIISIPDTCRSSIGESLNNNGSLVVGSLSVKSFDTQAAYCNMNKDEEWTLLPFPTDEELGGFIDTFREISTAKQVSCDGKVILGFLGSFTFPIVWIMNDKGEYEPDFFQARFVKASEEDIADESKPLYALSASYIDLSNNGKYVSMVGLIKDKDTNEDKTVPVIYDTESKTIKIYDEFQAIDEYALGLYPKAISNDGTFIGTIGTPFFGSSGSFIMRAGQTVAESFIEAFPNYSKKFGESDELGFNMPSDISADGQYILGYTFYSDDYYDEASSAYYVTYIISTAKDNAVDNIISESLSGNEMIYSIDGRKLNCISKGLNIVRNADGSVSKILRK